MDSLAGERGGVHGVVGGLAGLPFRPHSKIHRACEPPLPRCTLHTCVWWALEMTPEHIGCMCAHMCIYLTHVCAAGPGDDA